MPSVTSAIFRWETYGCGNLWSSISDPHSALLHLSSAPRQTLWMGPWAPGYSGFYGIRRQTEEGNITLLFTLIQATGDTRATDTRQLCLLLREVELTQFRWSPLRKEHNILNTCTT